MFRFDKISTVSWAILAALILLGAMLWYISRKGKRWNARMISNAALSIALSFILSYIRLYKLPQGGSITLASMLPIFMFSYAYGAAPGMLVGFAYGILQFIQSAYFVHPVELLLDYPLAFAMLGLAGFADKFSSRWGLVTGILLGAFGRFFCSFLAGVIFFASYAAEGQSVFAYSAIYNGLYLIPEAAICIVLAMVPQVQRIARQLTLVN